jgi:hypothetical protein
MNMLRHWTYQGFAVVLGWPLLLMACEPSPQAQAQPRAGVSWSSLCPRASFLRRPS